MDEIIFSVAIVISDRIVAGEEILAQAKAKGKSLHIIFDASNRRPLFGGTMPVDRLNEQAIFHVIKNIYSMANFSSECFIISLLYIERLCSNTQNIICRSNWQPILLAAMIVAQKIWDDRSISNADFSLISASYSLQDVNRLERKLLEMLEYNVSISASLYASYYFELRTMCERKEPDMRIRPLDESDASMIEARTASSEKSMKRDHRKWQSMGMMTGKNKVNTAILS